MKNEREAKQILAAIDNSKAPISWHCIDEPEIIRAIAAELNKIEKERKGTNA